MTKYCCLNGGRPQKSRRIIGKLGESNISFKNLPERSKRYIRDFVTTIVSGMQSVIVVKWVHGSNFFRLKRDGE